jgi:hypothetical protein
VLFSFFSGPDEFIILSNNTLDFKIPEEYSMKEKKKHSASAGDYIIMLNEGVPPVVRDTLFHILPRSVPINPMMPFAYLQDGRLPPFVINFFMSLQSRVGRPVSAIGRFYRSLDLIEAFREDAFLRGEDLAVSQSFLPLSKKLPEKVLQDFLKSCADSITQMQASGVYDAEAVERAADRLREMLEAVDDADGRNEAGRERIRAQITNLQEKLFGIQRKETEKQERRESKGKDEEDDDEPAPPGDDEPAPPGDDS